MAVKIQLRRDTSTNWTTVNPILSQGEVGLETDTNKQKIGNGTDRWNTLGYGILDDHIDDLNNPHSVTKAQVGLGSVPDLDTTDAVAHVSLTDNPHNVTASQTGAYDKTEFVDVSAGVGDAGKPVELNSMGQIDPSMIDASTFYYVAPHDPSGGTEYPDTTGETHGAFWVVQGLTAPYTFTGGDLNGLEIDNGDFMVWGTGGWSIMVGEMNPLLYMKLDKSIPLDNNGVSLPVYGKVIEVLPGASEGEVVEYKQFDDMNTTKAGIGFEGRAKLWADVGLSDADFAGLDIVEALTYIVSKMEIGQEVEAYLNDSTDAPNFVGIFPDASGNHITIICIGSSMIRFDYTHFSSKKKAFRTFYNWEGSLNDSGYVELMNKEDGLPIDGKAVDSELLDGKEATDFVAVDKSEPIDLNTFIHGTDFLVCNNTTLNIPTAVASSVYSNTSSTSAGGSVNVGSQIVVEERSSAMFVRNNPGGGTDTWDPWISIVTEKGGILTGQLKGITPVDAEDLTRKDYVDTLILKLTAKVNDLEERIANGNN